MQPGSRAICFLTALLAAGIELVLAALGHVEATPAGLTGSAVNEVAGNAPSVATAPAAAVRPAVTVTADRAAAPSAFQLFPRSGRASPRTLRFPG